METGDGAAAIWSRRQVIGASAVRLVCGLQVPFRSQETDCGRLAEIRPAATAVRLVGARSGPPSSARAAGELKTEGSGGRGTRSLLNVSLHKQDGKARLRPRVIGIM